jgi:protein ImuB
MTIYPPERPVRLFRSPEPIEVPATEMPEGPPLHFRWRRALYRVTRAEGPERIAAEWWRQAPGDAAASTRDYFRIEDSEGRRYWLYRQGLYGTAPQAAPPRWFMHGVFA